ncbi:MAG: hypothetical protein HYR96_12660 [Deltaproteobacteria bacterium]|nr:hypothetical protein [Deltaproteobacteria bacterium]MBI3294221.1 hypothetical protein [Deltaproteobacteria bacterium]
MMWLFRGLWVYKAEILFLIQVLSALRKTAAEITREYIKRKVAMGLKRSLAIVTIEMGLFLAALYWNETAPSLTARAVASLFLWAVTVYNAVELMFVTIPEIRAFQKMIRGRMGYAIRYVLEISVLSELMQMNILVLVLSLLLGISSRTWVGAHFSYLHPWRELFVGHP